MIPVRLQDQSQPAPKANRAPKKRSTHRALSTGEEMLAQQLHASNIAHVREHRFDGHRRWRFDFAILQHQIAVEIEGGIFSGGRHTRGTGFEADAIKYAEAVIAGWAVLRFSTQQVRRGIALRYVERLIEARERRP